MINLKTLRRVLNKDKTLIDFWMKLYKEAEAEGSAIPEVAAWVRFREVYAETPQGWVKRER